MGCLIHASFFYYDVDDFLSLSCFVRRLCIICLERYPYDEKSSIKRAWLA